MVDIDYWLDSAIDNLQDEGLEEEAEAVKALRDAHAKAQAEIKQLKVYLKVTVEDGVESHRDWVADAQMLDAENDRLRTALDDAEQQLHEAREDAEKAVEKANGPTCQID